MAVDNNMDSSSIEQLFISSRYNDFVSECREICRHLNKNDVKRISYSNDLYAIVMNVETNNRQNLFFESHKKYIDVHVIIEGEEMLDIISINKCPDPFEFSEEDDYFLYNIVDIPAQEFTLKNEDFKVVMVDQLHKANISINSINTNIKKMVIKVSKELFDREIYDGK